MPRGKGLSDNEYIKCVQIEIQPTKHQKDYILKWLSQYKDIYNIGIKYIRQNRNKKINSYIDLRREVLKILPSSLSSNNIPSQSIQEAIADVHKSYTIWNKAGRKRSLRYKKIANYMVLSSHSFSKKYNSFHVRTLGKEIKSSLPIVGIDHASKLTYKNRKFFIHTPKIDKIKEYPSDTWCAMDPGLRDFMTVWNSKGKSTKYNRNDCIDNLINKKRRSLDNFDGDERKQMKFKKRIHRRIKGVVTDLHWKTASELCRLYSEISIGKLSTIGIVRNCKRTVLGAFNKDKAYALSHFRFRERLKYKCKQYGRIYHEVNEYQTSITCNKCKHLHKKLGSSKVFECPHCNMIIDRDVNASINIFNKTNFGNVVPI